MNLAELIMIPCILASFLVAVLSSPVPSPCNRRIRPKKALKRIKEKNFLTVENALVGADSRIQEILRMKPRKRRDVRQLRDVTSGMMGASPCQWKWENTKKRPNEIPSSLIRAVCPGCSHKHYCQPIKYTIRVLANDGCDTKSGLTVWRWKQREITIAYVYTG
ncbi:hypothetical protein ACROYT_G017979 [Oculina patagonica]